MNLLKIMKRRFESDGMDDIFYRMISKNRLSVPRNWGTHSTSWKNLKKSLDDDNPDFALISVWAILEDEVKSKFPKKIKKVGDRRGQSICEISSQKLGHSSEEKKQLLSAMEKRNKVAHGRKTSTSWDSVNVILKSAYGVFKLN